jgi:hypothetical protein
MSLFSKKKIPETMRATTATPAPQPIQEVHVPASEVQVITELKSKGHMSKMVYVDRVGTSKRITLRACFINKKLISVGSASTYFFFTFIEA